MAGALALTAVLGKYYAVPAIAQVVRAAVVKNIDEKGRIPYQATANCPTPVAGISCAAAFPPVPAGKRLVIEFVNGEFNRVAGFDPTAALSFIGDDNLNKRSVLPTFARVGTTKLWGMALVAGALVMLPHVRTFTHVIIYGATMGIAGGVVTVVFFSVWGKFMAAAISARFKAVRR